MSSHTYIPLLIMTGVILEYELRDKSKEMKEIDLLHLTPEYVFRNSKLYISKNYAN